jgi:hypothetical protein
MLKNKKIFSMLVLVCMILSVYPMSSIAVDTASGSGDMVLAEDEMEVLIYNFGLRPDT